jgi:hypothetical protein
MAVVWKPSAEIVGWRQNYCQLDYETGVKNPGVAVGWMSRKSQEEALRAAEQGAGNDLTSNEPTSESRKGNLWRSKSQARYIVSCQVRQLLRAKGTHSGA